MLFRPLPFLHIPPYKSRNLVHFRPHTQITLPPEKIPLLLLFCAVNVRHVYSELLMSRPADHITPKSQDLRVNSVQFWFDQISFRIYHGFLLHLFLHFLVPPFGGSFPDFGVSHNPCICSSLMCTVIGVPTWPYDV